MKVGSEKQGKVEVNKKGHFYVASAAQGSRCVSWNKFKKHGDSAKDALASAWAHAVKLATSEPEPAKSE